MAKFRVLFYYFAEFLLSVLILALFLMGILKLTVLSPNFILKQFSKQNYYEELSDSIQDEMSNYIIQSGLEDSVLENIYTKEMVKEDLTSYVTNFYGGKKLTVSTDEIKKNLEDNILEYLEKNNITVGDQSSLDAFVDQILTVYQEKITFSNGLNSFQNSIVKANSLITVVFVIFLLLSIVLYALMKFICKRKIVVAAPCFTTSLLTFLGIYLFYQRVDVKNIVFWNDVVSALIKKIITSVTDAMVLGAVIFLVLGILNTFLWALKRRKRRPSSYVASE